MISNCREFEGIEIKDQGKIKTLSLMIQTPNYVEFRGVSPSPGYPDGITFVRLLTTLSQKEFSQYFHQLAEGAYVIQLPQELSGSQFSAPTPKVNLPPLTWERVSYVNEVPKKTRQTFPSLKEAMGNVYTSLPFTEVSCDLFAAYWFRRKAMVGRWINQQVVWKSRAFSGIKLN